MSEKNQQIDKGSKDNANGNIDSNKTTKETAKGTVYEQLMLERLAKNAYERSKEDSQFENFAIGREVNIGHRKLDDIIFRYEDNRKLEKPEDGKIPKRKFIFGQIKHKKDSSLKINYDSLIKSKMSGNMGKQFNLQQYFISFRTIREELENEDNKQLSEQLKNGKIKYVAIFTNAGIDKEQLEDKGCSLKEAPDDIKRLFTLEKSASGTPETNHFYQFDKVSEDLKNIFQRFSDLHIIAREFAHFVVSKKCKGKKEFIMGSNEAMYHYIIKKYHVALDKEVIRKTEKKNGEHVARFQEGFIENEKSGSKKELRDAIFEAIGESKKDLSEDDLKGILRKAEWKVHHNFGDGNRKMNLPATWVPVVDKDINDFLKCLVFSVNQPNVIDLLNQISSEKEKNFFLKFTSEGKALDITAEKFKDRLLKALGIPRREENWITGKEIEQFVKEQREALICFINTSLYEDTTMQYGEFNTLGKISASLDSFLNYAKREEINLLLKNSKVFCVCTTVTQLTAVKILQYLNDKNHKTENGQISIKLEDLKTKTFADRVEKAFKSENHNLLTIECTGDFNEKQKLVNLYSKFSNIIRDKANPNKKIILIIEENNLNTLTEKIRSHQISDPCKLCVRETDEIIVKDFNPKDDPFTKEMIFFQGQKEKINLEKLTGIADWKSYIADSSPNGIQNEGDILDVKTLILKNEEITVGSRPLGTHSLECAYASLPEEIKEINKENLVQKLLQQGPDSNTNVIYIVSGISGSNTDKKEKLIQNLDLINEQEEIKSYLGDIDSDSKIQITDDQFKDESFKNICREHSEKQIFWIYTERENTFKFQKLFNPNFYLKRKYYINEQNEKFLIEEDELIKKIKDRKIVIISGDPGMGKYTTMTKLYESKYLSESFLEKHWIIRINLREGMSAIKNVKLDKEIIDIVNFLSKFDSELDNDITKSLLEFALSKRKTTKKPLILVLDGFDEILDGDNRDKIVSLLEFLEEKTAAKVWITTLPLYKQTLENKLITFAIEFDPINYELYIKQFFKDRLQLILNKDKFDEIFDERQENSSIQRYSKAFFKKLESFFFEDASRFIGMPLHLYLMLNGSVNSFKYWVENNTGRDPNFDYLGCDIREVYEKFINKKFDIYFNKVDRRGREETRYTFDECNERLARCLILNVSGKSEKFLEIHKDKSSLAGIIKYYGSNVDFIATSFRDFFSAKSLMDWIQSVSDGKYPGINKENHQHFLIEVLRKPDFKLIRKFLNLEFGICFNPNNNAENRFEEKLRNGKIAEALLTTNKRSLLIGQEGTVLHIAVEEGNRNIIRFLLDSFKKHKVALKKFLFAPYTDGRITVILASDRKDSDTITLLLEAARGISQNAFKELCHLLKDHRLNQLANDGLIMANNGYRIL